MSSSRLRVPAISRLCATLAVLALTANAFDTCFTELGTAAAAMACCKHQNHGCADALRAIDCCQTRNAGTRVADAFALLKAAPVAAPVFTILSIASYLSDEDPPVWRVRPTSTGDSPPGASPPLNVPLRV